MFAGFCEWTNCSWSAVTTVRWRQREDVLHMNEAPKNVFALKVFYTRLQLPFGCGVLWMNSSTFDFVQRQQLITVRICISGLLIRATEAHGYWSI